MRQSGWTHAGQMVSRPKFENERLLLTRASQPSEPNNDVEKVTIDTCTTLDSHQSLLIPYASKMESWLTMVIFSVSVWAVNNRSNGSLCLNGSDATRAA